MDRDTHTHTSTRARTHTIQLSKAGNLATGDFQANETRESEQNTIQRESGSEGAKRERERESGAHRAQPICVGGVSVSKGRDR